MELNSTFRHLKPSSRNGVVPYRGVGLPRWIRPLLVSLRLNAVTCDKGGFWTENTYFLACNWYH